MSTTNQGFGNSRTHTECACLCNCLRFKFCLLVLMSRPQSVTVTQTAGHHTSNHISRNRRDEFSLYSTSSHQKTKPGLLSVCGLIHTTQVQFTQKPLIVTNLLKLNESFIKLQQTSTGGFWSAYSWKPKSIVLKLKPLKNSVNSIKVNLIKVTQPPNVPTLTHRSGS